MLLHHGALLRSPKRRQMGGCWSACTQRRAGRTPAAGNGLHHGLEDGNSASGASSAAGGLGGGAQAAAVAGGAARACDGAWKAGCPFCEIVRTERDNEKVVLEVRGSASSAGACNLLLPRLRRRCHLQRSPAVGSPTPSAADRAADCLPRHQAGSDLPPAGAMQAARRPASVAVPRRHGRRLPRVPRPCLPSLPPPTRCAQSATSTTWMRCGPRLRTMR